MALKAQILAFDRRILAWHRSNETSKRLDAIPGVGPALATALVASVADPKAFRSGRDFAAWIGLVPKQNSSGGKDKLGSITKQGDRYLRSLFTAGALAVALVAEAIKDCSRRGQIVLDCFGGSGTTLIAAEKVGRQARLIEFDPAYCDQILHRFERRATQT
jgi:transposase